MHEDAGAAVTGFRRLSRAGTAVWVVAIAAALSRCAPDPRTVRCSNDANCKEQGAYEYCVHGRCAECVTHAACGPKRRCAAGVCKP